jgi:hypothetical protein
MAPELVFGAVCSIAEDAEFLGEQMTLQWTN